MRKKVKDGTQWGLWWFAADTHSLVLDDERGHGIEAYSIALDGITDSARMLDWIFQLRMKAWVTNDIIGDLISAFQDIFRPQGTLCGSGTDKKLDAREHIERLLSRSA